MKSKRRQLTSQPASSQKVVDWITLLNPADAYPSLRAEPDPLLCPLAPEDAANDTVQDAWYETDADPVYISRAGDRLCFAPSASVDERNRLQQTTQSPADGVCPIEEAFQQGILISLPRDEE